MNNQQTLVDEAVERLVDMADSLESGSKYSDILLARSVRNEHAADLRLLLSEREKTKGAVEALAWYGEQARLCRLIHSGGYAGRHALSNDGGKRAETALSTLTQEKTNVG